MISNHKKQKKMEKLDYKILVDSVSLLGDLNVPDSASGLVIFAHGSGSSRFSPRNKMLATALQEHGIGTFLFDLLTEEEDRVYENRFTIDLLTQRLIAVTQWLMQYEEIQLVPIAYFGASTGASAALNAAAFFKETIKAVVSRAGRSDLAISELPNVTAPTLLIVGSLDVPLISMNKLALEKLNCQKEMHIVYGATHLFGEPGKLEEVGQLAINWFQKYLTEPESFEKIESL